jgi:imidazolonepropionase-like amidohydrolase
MLRARIFALGLLLVSAAGQQPAPLAITGLTIFDGTGKPAYKGTIVLDGERIAAIGADAKPPSGARIINGDGLTAIPGLFDMHTHLWADAVPGGQAADVGKHLKAYAYSGVTTVVDFSSDPEQFEPLRRLSRTTFGGARILLASRISTPGGHGTEGGWADIHTQEVRTPAEARAAVKNVAPYKPEFIKAFTDGWRYGFSPDLTSMEEETLAALCDEAHKNGMRVLTHTVTLEKAKIASRAGVDSLVHGIGNAFADDELLALMKQKGTGYASTMAVYEQHDQPADDLMKIVIPAGRAASLRRAPQSTAGSPARTKRWANLNHNIAALRDAGARFGLGTDAGMSGTYHGWATLRELVLLTEAGLSPAQALTAGTSGSAKLLGVDRDRGTLEPGKLADLVLIEGKPHQTITDIYKIRSVYLGGRELDRNALAKDIASPDPTPIAPVKATELIDDFETTSGRSALGTLWINGTDGGADKSEMIYRRVPRESGGMALAAFGKLAVKERPSIRMIVPCRPGAVEPCDVSDFQGVQFDIRGNGKFELGARTRRGNFVLPFDAGDTWKQVKIPFASLRGRAQWKADELTAIVFQLSGNGGEKPWMELDNVRFFR